MLRETWPVVLGSMSDVAMHGFALCLAGIVALLGAFDVFFHKSALYVAAFHWRYEQREAATHPSPPV